jgi:hypothetical protein
MEETGVPVENHRPVASQKFNPTKTEIIIFHVNGIECNLTFNFDQTTIDPVNTQTFRDCIQQRL